MTILDTNGLIYCIDNGRPLPESLLTVTEELREEYETAIIVNGSRTLRLQDISDLPGYDESYYLKQYAHYLNTFSGADLSSMRGIADVTILALVSCVLNEFGGTQQVQLELGDTNEIITVITNDGNLASRLTQDFNSDVVVNDVTTL